MKFSRHRLKWLHGPPNLASLVAFWESAAARAHARSISEEKRKAERNRLLDPKKAERVRECNRKSRLRRRAEDQAVVEAERTYQREWRREREKELSLEEKVTRDARRRERRAERLAAGDPELLAALERKREKARANMRDPVTHAKITARSRKRLEDPTVRARVRENRRSRAKARRKTDPAWCERQTAASRRWRAKQINLERARLEMVVEQAGLMKEWKP